MSNFASQLRNSNRLSNNKSTVLRPTVRYKERRNSQIPKTRPISEVRETVEKENLKIEDKLEIFLRKLGLENYLYVFKANQISGKDLALLSKEDLVDMKIPIGPRNRILQAVGNIETDSLMEVQGSIEEPTIQDLQDMILKLSRQQAQMIKSIQENQEMISKIVGGSSRVVQREFDNTDQKIRGSRYSQNSIRSRSRFF